MGRADGRHLKEIKSFQKIYTFVMPERNQAIVWHEVEVDVTDALEFIRKKKLEGIDITIFELTMSALLRIGTKFPELNRFIANHKYYARNEYSAGFAINVKGKIILRKIFFEPEWDLFTVSKKIKEIIDRAYKKNEEANEKTVDFFMKFPDFIITFCNKLYLWLIDKGILPWKYYKYNPLFSTGLVSDIGSFGLTSLFHHLYEWGTNSYFVTIGTLHKAAVVTPEGTLKVSDVIKFGFSVDERICDGKQLADGLLFFKECVENPEILEKPPAEVVKE